MNPLFTELRHSNFRVGAPALTLASSIVAVSNSYPSIATWANTVDVFISSAQFASPFWAALAAWEALRTRRRNLLESEETAARSLLEIRTPQYLASLSWAFLAVAAVLALLLARAHLIGLFDSPMLVPLAIPFVATALAVTVGFMIGDLLRRWIAIPIALSVVVSLYAFELFRINPYWLKATGPLHSPDVPEGTRFISTAPLGQIAAAVGMVALVIAVWAIRVRTDRLVTGIAAVLGVTLVASGAMLVASRDGVAFAGQQEDLYIIETSTPGVTLGVQPAYRSVEDDLGRAWGRVASLFSESGLAFTHLQQDPAPDYGDAPYATPFRLDLNPASETIAQSSIDMMTYDISACATHPIESTEGNEYWSGGQFAFMLWLRGSADDPPPNGVFSTETLEAAKALDELDLGSARAWVREHEPEIRTCLWEMSDFP